MSDWVCGNQFLMSLSGDDEVVIEDSAADNQLLVPVDDIETFVEHLQHLRWVALRRQLPLALARVLPRPAMLEDGDDL